MRNELTLLDYFMHEWFDSVNIEWDTYYELAEDFDKRKTEEEFKDIAELFEGL